MHIITLKHSSGKGEPSTFKLKEKYRDLKLMDEVMGLAMFLRDDQLEIIRTQICGLLFGEGVTKL